MSLDLLAPPPFLTADLPGVGGRIKTIDDDFEVEEIPAYQPCGAGEFLYLWIEKRGMGAEYFTRQVARRLNIPVGEVGTAGLKDRHAVARQMVSVPAAVEPRLKDLEGDSIRVLSVSRHGNKLKPGHLHGNRFRVLIRGVVDGAGELAAPVVECLKRDGLANFYGAQRFGRDGETGRLGFAMLRDGGQSGPRNPFLRKLALSAAQSALFNRCLARRMQDGLLRRVLSGDVMMKWPSGGMFVTQDVATEQGRFDRREIVTAGPMFGKKMFASADEAVRRETEVLTETGLTAQTFHGFGKLLSGTRRHNLIYVDDLTAVAEPDWLRVAFTLPAGSYATVLLRELTKNDGGDGGEEASDD
jgi:tRNA pseudouridine13 synthase